MMSWIRFAPTGSLGRMTRARFTALSLLWCGTALAGPVGDYGDALVGNNGDGINAYPGVVARWVSFYSHKSTVFSPQHARGSWVNPGASFQLGTLAGPLTTDSPQLPSHPSNDSRPKILLERLGPAPLSTLLLEVSAQPGHDASQPLFLNVFIDQNRDGQWKDGWFVNVPLAAWNLEWVVQDLQFVLDPSEATELVINGIRLESPTDPHWVRLLVTDRPVGRQLKPPTSSGSSFWDATMPTAHNYVGEIEDYLLEYRDTPDPNGGPGIMLRSLFLEEPDEGQPPKPGCYLGGLARLVYNRPLGENRPFLVLTDWCPIAPPVPPRFCSGIGTTFGVRISLFEQDNGCTDDPLALLGLYGPRWKRGVGIEPELLTLPTAFVGGNAAINCTNGPAAGPLPDAADDRDPPRYPAWSLGTTPVSSITGTLAVQKWIVCYPSGRKCRYRLYGFRVLTRSCGCEVQGYSVTPSPMIASALATLEGPGQPVEGLLSNGDLFERFVDPNGLPAFDPNNPYEPNDPCLPARGYPDPDFELVPDPNDPNQLSGGVLDPNVFSSPPFSLRLQNETYRTRPLYERQVDRATHIEFEYLCPLKRVRLRSTAGRTLTISRLGVVYDPGDPNQAFPEIDPNFVFVDPASDPNAFDPGAPCFGRLLALNVPEFFDLDELSIAMESGWIDNVTVRLGPKPDCNGNGQNDEEDLATGLSNDCNSNGLPDECEIELVGPDDPNNPTQPLDCNGNGQLDECEGLPDSNGNGIPDECECPGDFNGDGLVNLSDLGIILANFGISGATLSDGDANGDGLVNLTDLGIILANFGITCT